MTAHYIVTECSRAVCTKNTIRVLSKVPGVWLYLALCQHPNIRVQGLCACSYMKPTLGILAWAVVAHNQSVEAQNCLVLIQQDKGSCLSFHACSYRHKIQQFDSFKTAFLIFAAFYNKNTNQKPEINSHGLNAPLTSVGLLPETLLVCLPISLAFWSVCITRCWKKVTLGQPSYCSRKCKLYLRALTQISHLGEASTPSGVKGWSPLSAVPRGASLSPVHPSWFNSRNFYKAKLALMFGPSCKIQPGSWWYDCSTG